MRHCAAAAVRGLKLLPTATSRALSIPQIARQITRSSAVQTLPRAATGFQKVRQACQSGVLPDSKDSTFALSCNVRRACAVARHMTRVQPDSSNFSGSLTSPIYCTWNDRARSQIAVWHQPVTRGRAHKRASPGVPKHTTLQRSRRFMEGFL